MRQKFKPQIKADDADPKSDLRHPLLSAANYDWG
jgi:hypothetical protein